MAAVAYIDNIFRIIFLLLLSKNCYANDILGCGGFVMSHVNLDFSKIEIGLYTKQGSLKEKTECAPTNGYYFLPLYEKGDYVLKVHPPAGWSFEPSQVDLTVDGVSDKCSTGQDVNFAFNGFGITGKVITLGQKQGPAGINVQLVDDEGNMRNTVTAVGGDFHFTPVIPGKYTVKASHPRWKLDPSQAVVQVKEGNTALPFGVLGVKGFDVSGTITSFGSPIDGVYVLLYSKQENQKYRVEGCNTALLQGVKDAPICHAITDASGEFKFGLVPAGEYKLMALSTAPGQVALTYIVKPDLVPFTVKHDSLFIKNAFEVTGFTIVGTALTAPAGTGVPKAQVLLDGKPIGNTDAAGKFTLVNLQPGVYTVTFQHEQCEFSPLSLEVPATGPRRALRGPAARWRVCGAVTPGHARHVALLPDSRAGAAAPIRVQVSPDNAGKWCTFLAPGVYTAKVEVSEQEHRDGLQFYPLTQKVTVGHAAVDGVVFSQLKGKLSGEIQCKDKAACSSIPVTLRPLSVDGGYVGQPLYTVAVDGKYTFEEVLPGSVEVSVPTERLCWAEARHNVAVTQELAAVPAFLHRGYVLTVHASLPLELEYRSGDSAGALSAPSGRSEQCVPRAAPYTLAPRDSPDACHRFHPRSARVDTSAAHPQIVHFTAIAHAVVVKVISPEPVTDLVLTIDGDKHDSVVVGPLNHTALPDGGYLYQHTLYMPDGAVWAVSAWSRSLLMAPAGPVALRGGGACQRDALTVRARAALTRAGRLVPPVPGAAVTLAAAGDPGNEGFKLTQETTADGTYRFGPLDATKQYTITVEKESYVFSAPDENGDIVARKLAEITIELLDDADGTPLQGALVSVSGGAYRRNLASGADGRLRFGSLAPAQYYVKPHMKEYKFAPAHHILPLREGLTEHLTLRGVRVAWSCVGALQSLGGAGWARAALAARSPSAPPCSAEEATTDHNGAFRIRGLLPNCVYTIQLKESTTPELIGLKLAKSPPTLEIKDNKDIENVRLIAVQPHQITDANVLVYTPNIDHYKSLRLSLALETSSHTPIFSTKLDPTGYSQNHNPGLMYVLPRLPADNKTYILQLESTMSKATHTYDEEVYFFNSDGRFKHFDIEFLPKVRSSEQELHQTSLLVIPVIVALALVYSQRSRLAPAAASLAANMRARARPARQPQHQHQHQHSDLLDKASIDQILSTVNSAGKRVTKKKAM